MRENMGIRMVTRRIFSPNRKTKPGPASETTNQHKSRVLILIPFLCLTFLAGCSGGSTPLYYTANSGVSPQPQAQAQMQPQIQPQGQANLQPPNPPPMQGGQPAVSYNNLQQQLMQQTTRSSAPSYKDYRVGAEDLLAINVYGQDALTRELRVNGQGQISMPLVGVISVGGMTTQQIEKRLKDAYGSEYLRNPQITVEVKEFHHQRVAVTGAVPKPGYYDIIGPRTLLEVLAMAGGFTNRPAPEAGDVIHVIRHQSSANEANSGRAYPPQSKTLVINIHRLVSGAAPDLNVMVANGDVVYVPFAGTAYVSGGVRKPGNVTVKDNLTVTQAVSMAQGVDPVIGTNKVIIMRFDQQGRPVKLEADLKDITAGKEADVPVQNNDTIVVEESGLKKKLYVIRQLLPIPSGGYSIPTQ
jgi:polysaccharide export outer membrane protein